MRLIDADVLASEIQETKDLLQKGLGKDAKFAYMSADSVLKTISNQSTAYDPDKVVAQLEDKVKEYDKRIERRNGDCYFDETEKIKALEERARGIERAIEIVKGGGVDGD